MTDKSSPPLSDALTTFLVAQGFPPDDIHARDKRQATPLMSAARLAPPALVTELLAAGADLGAVNADGNQALWQACVGEIEENIRRLIAAGASLNHVNATGATALMFAVSSGRAKAAAQLLAAGADPSFDTGLGLTALDMAATRECLDLMLSAVKARRVRA